MASSVFIGYFGGARISYDGTSITFPGPLLAPDGSASAPSYSFANDADSGWYRPSTGSVVWTADGTPQFRITGTQAWLSSTMQFGFASDTVTNAFPDVILSRGAANRLDLASGDSFNVVSGNVTVGGDVQAAAGGAFYWNTRSVLKSPSDGQIVAINAAQTGASAFGLGPLQSATSAYKLIKKVTGIADAVATDVITVTVPNANHAAAIRLTFLASTGSTDAFESSRVAEGAVVLARTTGVATVATVATLELAQIATVGGGATLTLAYGVSAMTGAVGATQTFTVQVTLNDSGNLGSNQCVVLAELVNAEASGVTIA